MEVKRAGIRIGVCVTPMLRFATGRFPSVWRSGGRRVRRAAVQALTRPVRGQHPPDANDILTEFGWDERSYRRAFDELRRRITGLYEGQDGFMPE